MSEQPILLGINGFVQYRNTSQRNNVLDAARAMLDKGGDLVVREDLIWATIQPTESGGYNWSYSDAVTAACADKGWRMWWLPAKPPNWATWTR